MDMVQRSVSLQEKTGNIVNMPESEPITNEELLELDVDILVPAALEELSREERVENKGKASGEGQRSDDAGPMSSLQGRCHVDSGHSGKFWGVSTAISNGFRIFSTSTGAPRRLTRG